MSEQTKKVPPHHRALFAGIDVGAQELVLVMRDKGKPCKARSFANTLSGRNQLVNKLVKLPGVIVCLEATGVYHLDLSLALADAGVKLMVINPKASHNFAKALMSNSKTDGLDAHTLAQYAERMDFVAWTRPSPERLELRSFSRRINALTRDKAAAKNQLHALSVAANTPKAVLKDARLTIAQLEKRIATLSAGALALIGAHPQLQSKMDLLLSVKGIAITSAVALLGELVMLPPDLSMRQWVKFAGLDPRSFDSGKSVHKPARLSKAGNRHIRAALYMPALSAKQHDPHVKAYFLHLTDNGKKPLQAVCAVMRKLLHAIYAMLHNNEPFNNKRFYKIPA